MDLADLPISGRFRSAAFATTVAGSDGLVRQYPRQLLLGGESKASVQTAPWMVAQLLDLPSEKKSKILGWQDGDIFYSLPRVEERTSAASDGYRHILEYLPISSLFEGTSIRVPEGRFEGKIVVIGSSNGASQDLHSTPVGTRSGSEILINAMRTLTAFQPLKPVSRESSFAVLFDVVFQKISSAIFPALVILLCLLAREWLYDLKKFVAWRLGVWIVTSTAVIVFSILIELVTGLSSLGDAARQGRCIDLVTPFVTVGLDFYREVATAIIERIEAMVRWGMWCVGNLWQRMSLKALATETAHSSAQEPITQPDGTLPKPAKVKSSVTRKPARKRSSRNKAKPRGGG